MTTEQITAINDTFSFLRRALCEPQIDEVELYHLIQYNIKALKDANVDSNIVDHIESLFDIY